jgi:glycosyltransferase involved in cell wall biosynthesis
MSPFFSIIIPTYNRANYIQRAISCVLDQTFGDFEIIVVDDGSTDNTSDIIKLNKDSRVHYFYKVNEERGIARNYGLTRSTGKYVSFLDSDDLLYTNHLQVIYDSIQQLKNPEVLHSDYEFRDESGNVLSRGVELPPLLNNHLLENSAVGVLGVFIRRDIAGKHPFIPHRSAIVGEDLYLWLTLASRYPFHHVPSITGGIVLHDGRSLNDRDAFKFLKSALLLINNLAKDPEFINYYSKNKANYFFSKSLIQVALVYSEQGSLKWAYKLLYAGMSYSLRIVFNRTFLATVRMIIIKSLK